jgi:hypothetical protein
MPPKHQGTKNHKRLSIIVIALVAGFLLFGVDSKFEFKAQYSDLRKTYHG